MIPTQRKKWLRWWWPAFLWAALITSFSADFLSTEHTSRIIVPVLHWLFPAMSARRVLIWHHYIRKAAHIFEFFILSLLVVRGIRGERRGWKASWAVAAIAVAAGWAALDELHQAFVPSRGASMRDVLIDVSGAVLAQILYALIIRMFEPGEREARPSE